MTFSNKDFSIDGDEGIYRRGKLQFYESKFEDNIEDDYKHHRYKKILNFESNFDKEEYKNAYFHLLLKHVDKLEIPKDAEKNFKDIVDENDDLKSEIEDNFIITRNENDKISKMIVIEKLHNYSFKDILAKLKSMGVKYNKNLRLDGEKRIFLGLKKI
jgi:DnaJ-class molecular chaperone